MASSASSKVAGNRVQQKDEMQALQAIYGEEVCETNPGEGLVIVHLPSRRDSKLEVRVVLHDAYPSERPPFAILTGVHITGGTHTLAVQRLDDLFCPGDPVIYDWLEWVREQPALLPPAREQPAAAPAGEPAPEERLDGLSLEDIIKKMPDKEYDSYWRTEMAVMREMAAENPGQTIVTRGEPFTEKKSTFQAHLAPVTTQDGVHSGMAAILMNPKVQKATHNINAWRIRLPGGGIMQDCYDDGETGAGGRLLHLLEIVGAEDVLVIVSRWYGGVLLGPARFTHINNAARQLLDECGYVKQGGGSAKGPSSRSAAKKKAPAR